MIHRIRDLNPATYGRHPIHAADRVWSETNCYVDVVAELLHGLGLEPLAALPFTLSVDFEGDQWTFFKFAPADILELYALHINELNPWRELVLHVEEQVARGRPVLVELDSFYLPDTHGSAYKIAHVKSTVAVNAIDVGERWLGYFHGQGYHELRGDDFEQIFQTDGLVHERMLPPYIEYVKPVDEPRPSSRPELHEASLRCLRRHLALVPRANPFHAFERRFREDLAWLQAGPIETFHNYAFATFRQYGACFELLATYLRWLADGGERCLEPAIDAFTRVSTGAKTLQFQLARAIARGNDVPLGPLTEMATLWERGVATVADRYGG